MTASIDRRPRTLAIAFASEMAALADKERAVQGDGGLTEALTEALETDFAALPSAERLGAEGRSEAEYWADHGLLTANLMAYLAKQHGGNIDLYRRVGRIHDIDYLAFPHDTGGEGDRHPVPLVRRMAAAWVHPAICLAVLEHAPYLNLDQEPSSRLSAALSAAEDLATLSSLDPPSTTVDALSAPARALLELASPCRMVTRASTIRVEVNLERYINAPLAKVIANKGFRYDV